MITLYIGKTRLDLEIGPLQGKKESSFDDGAKLEKLRKKSHEVMSQVDKRLDQGKEVDDKTMQILDKAVEDFNEGRLEEAESKLDYVKKSLNKK